MQHSPLLNEYRNGFSKGYTSITKEEEDNLDTGIDFGINKLSKGETFSDRNPKESVWVLMNGKAVITFNSQSYSVERNSLFDEPPTALHIPSNIKITIKSETNSEWALARAENDKSFEPMLFTPETLKPEYRGEGLVQGTCLRNVRLIFDKTNRADANLVIGEVINYPGRWSSYPPHHHPQPEIYQLN